MGFQNMDDADFQLEMKSIISSHMQDLARPGTNGIKDLSDFLKIAEACHIEADHMLCVIVDSTNPLFIKMRALTQDLIKARVKPEIIGKEIILYTQELIRTYQGQYPEQALKNE